MYLYMSKTNNNNNKRGQVLTDSKQIKLSGTISFLVNLVRKTATCWKPYKIFYIL